MRDLKLTKILSMVIAFAIVITSFTVFRSGGAAAAQSAVTAPGLIFRVDGVNRPVIDGAGNPLYAVNFGGAIYLPIDAINPLFGKTVFYLDGDADTVLIYDGQRNGATANIVEKPEATGIDDVTVKNDTTVKYNGNDVQLTAHPILANGELYLPARATAALFGSSAAYDAKREIVFFDNDELTYENAAFGIGIKLPKDYMDKITIIEEEQCVTFVHDASNDAINRNSPNSAQSTNGTFFTIQKHTNENTSAIETLSGLGRLLLTTDDYSFFLRRPTDVEYDYSDPDGPATKEYRKLYTQKALNDIADSAYAADYAPAPTYSALNRVSDEGMEDDLIYNFSDGYLDAQTDEALLLINGSFTAKATGFVLDSVAPGATYLPIEIVAETVGGYYDWEWTNDEKSELTVYVCGHTVKLGVNSEKAAYDGEEITLKLATIMRDDLLYFPCNDDFTKYFNLDYGFLPGNDIKPFAGNPIITVDRPATRKAAMALNTNTQLSYVKARLYEALSNTIKNNKGARFEEEINAAAPQIRGDIAATKIIGQSSRYLILKGPYNIIYDELTKDIYIYGAFNGGCGIYRFNVNDPGAFISGYVAG